MALIRVDKSKPATDMYNNGFSFYTPFAEGNTKTLGPITAVNDGPINYAAYIRANASGTFTVSKTINGTTTSIGSESVSSGNEKSFQGSFNVSAGDVVSLSITFSATAHGGYATLFSGVDNT